MKEQCLELMESCSNEVSRLLYQYVGLIDVQSESMTEAKMLSYIKSVAVNTIHPQVHRWGYTQLSLKMEKLLM